MAQGLQVWDSAGKLVFDTSSMLGRLIATVTANGTNGSYTENSGVSNTITACVLRTTSSGAPPYLQVNGKVVTWNYGVTGGVEYPKANSIIGIFGY